MEPILTFRRQLLGANSRRCQYDPAYIYFQTNFYYVKNIFRSLLLTQSFFCKNRNINELKRKKIFHFTHKNIHNRPQCMMTENGRHKYSDKEQDLKDEDNSEFHFTFDLKIKWQSKLAHHHPLLLM